MLATVALMASLLGAGPDVDPVLAEAKAHVEEARKAFAKKKYGVALTEFQAAQRLKPAPVLWFNIGKCYEKLNEAPSALRAFRLFLHEAPATPDRKEVTAAISRMETKLRARGLQQLLVLATPAGATASIPGRGSLPVPATFELKPGRYAVTISLFGFETVRRDVTIAAKAKGSPLVEVALPVAAPPMPASSPARPDSVASRSPPTESAPPAPVESRPPVAESSKGTVTVAVRSNDPAPPKPASDKPLETRPVPVDPGPSLVQPRQPLALGPPPPERGRTWTWVAGGASLVGAGVGVGFGLSASSARSELVGSLHDEPAANALFTRAQSSALYANIGYGAAAVAGIAAVVLFIVESPGSSGAQAMTAPQSGPPVVFSF